MHVSAVELAVLALASFRVTRLIVTDTFWANTRARLLVWLDRHGPIGQKAAELLSCSWCTGVWVSGGLYAAWRAGVPAAEHLVLVAAVAGGQTIATAVTSR